MDHLLPRPLGPPWAARTVVAVRLPLRRALCLWLFCEKHDVTDGCRRHAGTLVFAWMVKRDLPWLEFGLRHASIAQVKALFRPAVAFMCFPIGNSLNL